MKPAIVNVVMGGKRYNTDTADTIADNAYWDGHNYERRGTNVFLFRTQKGNYFRQDRSQWQGADDGRITPLTRDEAISLYEELREKHEPFEDAFPGVAVEEA